MTKSRDVQRRLAEHVRRLGEEHPPIDLATVDYDVRDPEQLRDRYGHVLDYMARAELEVERNVLELATLLPDPPEVDRLFYSEVWGPQEARHGEILDRLQVIVGRPPAQTDVSQVSAKLRILGFLAHLEPIQDVVRMLYYLTGMTTERSALLSYHLLSDGLTEMGEHATVTTVIEPIRRQEPGHYAFYQMQSRALWDQLAPWQKWLTRRLRALSFTPVAATDDQRLGDVGRMMQQLGVASDDHADSFAEQVSRVERDLLWAQREGLRVPPYIAAKFREAIRLALVTEPRVAAAGG